MLYRGSKNGFTASSFHKLCDGKRNTVTIVLTTCGSIFGGFASTEWSQYSEANPLVCWEKDPNAFVFSDKVGLDKKIVKKYDTVAAPPPPPKAMIKKPEELKKVPAPALAKKDVAPTKKDAAPSKNINEPPVLIKKSSD